MQDKTSKRKKVPRIKVRAVWTIVEKLKDKMSASLEIRFRQGCFGDYLNIKNVICQSNLLLGVAWAHFEIYPKRFCLITGFRFGPVENYQSEESPNSFRRRYFEGFKVVRQRQLEQLFGSDWTGYPEDDCLRICLLMVVESFKATQEYQIVDNQLLNLADNLEAWNQFTWGTYLWPNTCTNVYNLNQRYQPRRVFSLPDCVWPFKFGILESFPEFISRDVFYIAPKSPRFLSWAAGKRLAWNSVNQIIQDSRKVLSLEFLFTWIYYIFYEYYVNVLF
ncbi:hypothetical protein Hanom_Chr07g00609091 [Helianthus anomalus]